MSSNQANFSTQGSSTSSNTLSIIIKIVIIAIVVLLIIYFCYLIIRDYLNTKNSSPYFIRDIQDGSTTTLVDGRQVTPSTDGKFGTEFTYSFWIYIKDSNFTNTSSTCNGKRSMKNIFVKGSDDYDGSTLPLLQSPGMWLYPDDNKLAIVMNTFNNHAERCDIGNVPVNKWVHLTVMLIGKSLDVYVNCSLKKRCKLSGVPRLNFEDLRISSWGGFNGYISRFRYYNYALEPYQISQICGVGPASMDSLVQTQPTPPYLGQDYWTTTGFPKALGGM